MSTLAKILLCILVIYTLITCFRNLNSGFPVLDSPVYLYAGQMIKEGKVPYGDFFDHKPPGIHFINALALNIHQDLGIVVVETTFILIALMIGFYILVSLYGKTAAFIGSLIWIMTLVPILHGGNFPEDYVLPFQFGAIMLFLLEDKYRKSRYRTNFLLGVLLGLTILIKQNTIGVFLAYLLVKTSRDIFRREWVGAMKLLLSVLLGVLIVLLPVVLYLWWNNVLLDAYNQIFKFNIYYSGKPFTNVLNVIYYGTSQLMFFSGITIISFVAWFDLLVISTYNLNIKKLGNYKSFIWFLVILLPMELLLSSVSGKFYFHYYFSWLPVMAILSGYFIFLLFQVIKRQRSFNIRYVRLLAFILLLAILVWVPLKALTILVTSKFNPDDYELGERNITSFVRTHTKPNDYVLVWGARTEINYGSYTKSPSRYVYQTPLYMVGYQKSQMYDEWLEGVKKHRPVYIIDEIFPPTLKSFAWKPITCNEEKNPYYFDDFTFFKNLKPLPKLIDVMNYICNNYYPEVMVGNWRAWRIKEQ
jgi:hypothetical protein